MEHLAFLLLGYLFNTVIAFIYVLNTYCLGCEISRCIVGKIEDRLLGIVMRWAIGWNTVVFFVYLLGLASWLNVFSCLVLSTSGFLVMIVSDGRSNFKRFSQSFFSATAAFREIFGKNKLVVGLLLCFTALMYFIALAPISKTDELTYYYHFVKRIIAQGSLSFDYHQVLSFQPMAQQLWYVPVFGLGATEASALLNLFTSFLIIIVSYLWLIRYTDRTMALLGVLATYLNLNGISFYPAPNDNVACWLWGLVSFIVTYEFLYSKHVDRRSRAVLFLLGMVYVSACLTKLTNIVIVTFCIMAISYRSLKDMGRGSSNYTTFMGDLFFLSIPFLVLYVPHLVRIYAWTGNPFFPALLNVFEGKVFDPVATQAYFDKGTAHWKFDFVSIYKYVAACVKSDIRYNLSPLLMFLPPLAIAYLVARRKYLIAISAILALGIIFFSRASDRMLLGGLAFLVLTMFIGGTILEKNAWAVRIIKAQAICIVFIALVYFPQFGKYVFGLESKNDFLKMKIQTYGGIQWANGNLPRNSKIYANTREKYYFDFRVYITEEYPLVFGIDAREIENEGELLSLFRKHGITHFFWADKGDTGKMKPYYELVENILKDKCKLIYSEEEATVLGVRHPFRKPITGRLEIYELI